MDKYIKNLPFGLVFVLSSKCIALGASFSDVAFLAVLSVLGSYLHFATKEKQIDELKHQHNELKQKFEEKSKEIDEVKNHLSGLKLATAIRPSVGKF